MAVAYLSLLQLVIRFAFDNSFSYLSSHLKDGSSYKIKKLCQEYSSPGSFVALSYNF